MCLAALSRISFRPAGVTIRDVGGFREVLAIYSRSLLDAIVAVALVRDAQLGRSVEVEPSLARPVFALQLPMRVSGPVFSLFSEMADSLVLYALADRCSIGRV